MNFKHLFLWASVALLVGCASTSQQHKQAKENQSQSVKAQRPPVILEHMDVQFLYLASQQALAQRQPALAARFLKALVKKEPDEMVPRFELVDLLLLASQKKQSIEAKKYMVGINKATVESMNDDNLSAYQQLYARTLIANNEVEPAAKILDTLLQKQPERIEVRLLLARLYMIDKNYDQAEYILKQGLKLKKDLRLQELQVQLAIQQGQFKKADKRLAHMQKEYPQHENIVLQRSELAEQKGDVKRAERLFKDYIDIHGEQAIQSLSKLADFYMRHEKFDDALATYQKLLPLTANSAAVYMSLGKVYYQVTSFEEAVKMFSEAVKRLEDVFKGDGLVDEQAVAYFYLGASLEASRNLPEATKRYKKISQKHVFYGEAQLRLANIEMRNQDFDLAENRLNKLLQEDVNNLEAYELLSSMRLQQKAYKKLIQETEPALKVGFSSGVMFNRAVAFESLKKFGALDKTLDEILRHKPASADTLNFYGYSLADRGLRLNDAQSMIKKALEVKPDDGYYLDSLAWVYFKQGKFNQAVKVQLRAIKEVPSDPVMQEHLGDMYWKANNPEKARKHWNKAVELNHKDLESLHNKIKNGLT